MFGKPGLNFKIKGNYYKNVAKHLRPKPYAINFKFITFNNNIRWLDESFYSVNPNRQVNDEMKEWCALSILI